MSDETHDPQLASWVESANDPTTDFPIQNLPFGVFRSRRETGPRRGGVAIGGEIADLAALVRAGLLDGPAAEAASAASGPALNPLLALGRPHWSALRRALSRLLAADAPAGVRERAAACLVPQAEAELLLPVEIGDYTDFFASIHHATNASRAFGRPADVRPSYHYVPHGYHGRASSVAVSGSPIRRPHGQRAGEGGKAPVFGPSGALDYELEVGVVIGPGNPLGRPVPIADAEDHVFGLCLVNDWSARDVQVWESVPLGPFLSKSFLTSMSPWIVTLDALAPFRAPLEPRPDGAPAPLPHLSPPPACGPQGIDVTLGASITSAAMRERGMPPFPLCRSSLLALYWSAFQMVAHHSSNGCNLRPGDLFATGTVSGPGADAHGCLLERTMNGSRPFALPTGEQRSWLEDGDEVVLTGRCSAHGAHAIGFGECRGRIAAA